MKHLSATRLTTPLKVLTRSLALTRSSAQTRSSALLLIAALLAFTLASSSAAASSLAATPKIVMAEEFTATWCGDCPNARCALEMMLDEFGDQLIVAELHMIDILDTDWTNARATYYDVGPIPHVQFDGKYEVVGARSCSEAAAAYRQVIQQRLGETGGTSPIAASGRWWYDDTALTLEATFRLEDPASLPALEVYLLALEDDIAWQGQTYNHVTRATYSEGVALAAVGDSATVTASFPLETSWDLSQFECVAFIQRPDGDHEIYQAARLAETGGADLAFSRASVSLPEPAGLAIFHATLRNSLPQTDEVTVSLQNDFGWGALFGLEGGPFGVDPIALTLAPGEERAISLLVFAAHDERIGTGYLVTQSALTGILRRSRGRVWNGSPSILIVDDDYVDPTERLITAGLTSAGYMFDVWNVTLDHLAQSPGVAALCEYDVVLWHHGWATTNLLSAGEVANIMAYMDAGGRLILSSQDYLSTTSPGNFTLNYLGVANWTPNVGAVEAIGVPVDPIGNGLDFPLEYPVSTYDRADDVTPSNIGSVCFQSESAKRIAVRADNGVGRSVFFAFALNAIDSLATPPNDAGTLLDRSLGWLIENHDTSAPDVTQWSGASRILFGAPNPFVPARASGVGLTIWVEMAPEDGPAPVAPRLLVLDAAGRVVRELDCGGGVAVGGSVPDRRAVVWDGRDENGRPVTSGSYYLLLSTARGTDGTRIMLVR